MTFWRFIDKVIDRLPGWPTERQVVMGMTYGLGLTMLIMARDEPKLWNVELFKTLITVVLVTGFVNMILAFYFSANKDDEAKTENTGKALDAITATANASVAPDNAALQDGETVTLERSDK